MATERISENPITYNLPANSELIISCQANAAWLQRVTVTIPSDGQSPYYFQGVGEPGDMKLASGNDAIELPSNTNEHPAIFYFEFDESGTGTEFKVAPGVVPAAVKPTPWGSLVTISSEDGADSDLNDSIVFINTANVKALAAGVNATGMWKREEQEPGAEELPRGVKRWVV